MARRTIAALTAIALVLAACGGGDDTGAGDDDGAQTSTETTAATDTTAASDDDASSDGGDDDGDADSDDGGADTDSGGTVDGSGVDWATVDLTTIDWANIDMRTIDFQAISDNPTAADLSEETQQLIQSRIDPGSATLTIGDTTWEFESFLCAFGYESTESDRFVLSTSAFITVDGTQLQMTADIDDPSGQERSSGADVTHRVDINDISDFENPSVSWELQGTDLIQVDGYDIAAAGTFVDGTGASEPTEGTLTGTCGTTSRDSR